MGDGQGDGGGGGVRAFLATCFMLHYDIFSCTCSQVSRYAMTSSLALANMFDAML